MTDYSYNPQTLRLDRLIARSPDGSFLQDFSYSFDGVGNVTQIQDNVHTATQSFTYDALNRLTSAVGAYGSFNYQYDSIGNLTHKEGVLQNYGIPGVGKPHAITSTSTGMTFGTIPGTSYLIIKGAEMLQVIDLHGQTRESSGTRYPSSCDSKRQSKTTCLLLQRR